MKVLSMAGDQADTLRKMTGSYHGRRQEPPVSFKRAAGKGIRVISVTSGKGGVGKTNVVVNLALGLARLGKKVLMIDADLGLANIDVLLGLTPSATLNDVFRGDKRLADILVDGPGGIKLVPAGSGVQQYTSLGQTERLTLLDELDQLEEEFDIFLIDTEAGISENVTYFTVAAQEIVLVVSPEPTSITDVYALIKLLATRYGERCFKVLVNMARDGEEALEVYAKLCTTTNRFLDISLDYLGYVTRDERLLEAVKRQRAVYDLYPDAASSKCFATLAKRIAENTTEQKAKGNIQFFFRKYFAPSLGLENL